MDAYNPNSGAITKAVLAVMKETHRLKKDDTNKHGGYAYVSVDDVKDAIRPLLAKHGLDIRVSEKEHELITTEKEGKSTLQARYVFGVFLRHESGETDEPDIITICLPHTGAQTAGAARSYAVKEWSKARFLLSTGEKDEGADADSQKQDEYEAQKPPQKYDRNPIVKREFERLQRDIHQIANMGTLEDLALYWKNNQDIVADMPADWKKLLVDLKQETKTNLSQKVAA